jgi:hypothetical protein
MPLTPEWTFSCLRYPSASFQDSKAAGFTQTSSNDDRTSKR